MLAYEQCYALLPSTSTGKQDIQEASMENKKKRRVTPRWEKTPATIAETESHEMPTACHNQGTTGDKHDLAISYMFSYISHHSTTSYCTHMTTFYVEIMF